MCEGVSPVEGCVGYATWATGVYGGKGHRKAACGGPVVRGGQQWYARPAVTRAVAGWVQNPDLVGTGLTAGPLLLHITSATLSVRVRKVSILEFGWRVTLWVLRPLHNPTHHIPSVAVQKVAGFQSERFAPVMLSRP